MNLQRMIMFGWPHVSYIFHIYRHHRKFPILPIWGLLISDSYLYRHHRKVPILPTEKKCSFDWKQRENKAIFSRNNSMFNRLPFWPLTKIRVKWQKKNLRDAPYVNMWLFFPIKVVINKASNWRQNCQAAS